LEAPSSVPSAAPAAAAGEVPPEVPDLILEVLEVNPCIDCKKSFKRAGSLKTHLIKEHKYKSVEFICDICKNTFDEPKKLTRHKKGHNLV
jgi:hypothetical protein